MKSHAIHHLGAAMVLALAGAQAQEAKLDRTVLPIPDKGFGGVAVAVALGVAHGDQVALLHLTVRLVGETQQVPEALEDVVGAPAVVHGGHGDDLRG